MMKGFILPGQSCVLKSRAELDTRISHCKTPGDDTNDPQKEHRHARGYCERSPLHREAAELFRSGAKEVLWECGVDGIHRFSDATPAAAPAPAPVPAPAQEVIP